MKCPLMWEALVTQSGEVKRPEQPCPHEMNQLDTDTWTCPMHGLVTVIDDLTGKWDAYVQQTVENGKRRRFRRFRRG